MEFFLEENQTGWILRDNRSRSSKESWSENKSFTSKDVRAKRLRLSWLIHTLAVVRRAKQNDRLSLSARLHSECMKKSFFRKRLAFNEKMEERFVFRDKKNYNREMWLEKWNMVINYYSEGNESIKNISLFKLKYIWKREQMDDNISGCFDNKHFKILNEIINWMDWYCPKQRVWGERIDLDE